MPKSKNKSKNAFWFFMQYWRQREEARGRKFPNGFRDVQANPECNEEWQGLSKQQKSVYENMAKDDKISSQMPEKKTTIGESISLLEELELKKEEFISVMHEYLKSTITRAVDHNVLPQLKFCFVHVNWFFKRLHADENSIEYFPAEYAIGIFSLENGMEDVHHGIVGAQIPLGFRREAMETSQNTHQIPPESSAQETDFAIMYKRLINFLEPRKIVSKYPPLFTLKSDTEVVQSWLEKLCEAAKRDTEQFLIYEIESLFKYLADEAYKNRTDRDIKYNSAYAEHIFARCDFIYKRGHECAFHKFVDGGSVYCSKSILYQWTWKMCEEFCDAVGVRMIPGIHLPKEDDSKASSLAQSMANLDITNYIAETSTPELTLHSMTGVTEQYRIKVSERTYDEDMRRRNATKHVVIVDYSKNSSPNQSFDESVSTSGNKLTDNSTEEIKKRYVPNYSGDWARSSNIASGISDNSVPRNDEKNFPPIGGRGVLCKGRGHPRLSKKD